MVFEDDLDRIMSVMEAAFDPAYGEAWTRSQVLGALLSSNCFYSLAGPDGSPPSETEPTAGFAMVRRVLDEEELLLLAVKPEFRSRGIGGKLLKTLQLNAPANSVTRIFLEMRADNQAKSLYLAHNFTEIGRRKGYYRNGTGEPRDAITFAWECQFD